MRGKNGACLDYYVDIVMCVDATARMASIMDDVKANVLSYGIQLANNMEECHKHVDQLRVKVIVFRNYDFDAEPMKESNFFVLPDEQGEFETFVNNIEAKGGECDASNALEALTFAIKSDWARDGDLRRHIIMMYTNAPAVGLSERVDIEGYPTNFPKSVEDLENLWEGRSMEKRAKRMIIWAPDAEPWTDIGIGWNQVLHIQFPAGDKIEDEDIQSSIFLLTHSI